ncbi:MAG: hypothetical protein LBP56_08390 [Odoribacteraceae bacterium]|nr:hypothetical protein [Odoribacteraceae bacterium]
MRKTTLLGFVLGGGLLWGGCSDTDDNLVKYLSDAVEITDSELLLPSSGKATESTIITSDHPWTLEGGNDWCSFSPRDGKPGTTTVYFTLLPNEGYDDRSVIVTLHSSAGDLPLTVYQKKRDAIIFSKDRFDNIGMDGGEIKVALQTNVAYRVEIPAANAWIHSVPTRASTRGLETREETFQIDATSNFNARKGIIVFINLENEKMQDTVTVYQVQRDQIILESSSVQVPLEGETIRVPVRSNIDYEVVIPSGSAWIHQEPSPRADEIVLRVEESLTERSATITIRDKNNTTLTASLAIQQQEKATLKFETESTNVAREGGKVKVTVLENLGGKFKLIVPEYAPWIKLSTAPGTLALTPHEIWLDVEANGTDDLAREGRVFLQGTEDVNLFATFTIFQAGGREPEPDERITLLAIAAALDIENWQNNYHETWLATNPLNKWTNVKTDPTGEHVVSLSFSTLAKGQLPKEIGDLAYLETLQLNVSPGVGGKFPPQIANLKKLKSLELSAGSFEGLIPEFGALTAMKSLIISGGFSGEAGAHMDAIGWLENLETLELRNGHNKYGTKMPDTWRNLKNLQTLVLNDAGFSNVDPVEGMTALRSVDLQYLPDLTGSLPAAFGDLKELNYLRLYHVNLDALPASFGDLEKLATLDIRHTNIATLPSSVSKLKALQSLTLENNKLTALPEALSGMTNLTTLVIDGNKELAGELPVNIGNLTKLTKLTIINNPLLAGAIPESISRLQKITNLTMQGNAFTALPTSIGEMVNLTSIRLDGNDFQGTIPESIGNLKNLTTLYINRPEKNPYKGLIGSIPASIGNITTLKYFRLENNQLSGSIPETFSGLTSMMEFHLSNNELTGSLPGFFATFPDLTELYLDNNGLSGSLPVDFRDFARIQELNLYNNNFEGTIPEGFQGKGTSYTRTGYFLDLRLNKLKGVIPQSFLDRTFENSNFKYREQKPGYGFTN